MRRSKFLLSWACALTWMFCAVWVDGLAQQHKLWIAGSHAQALSNEVWSLHLPKDWKP